MEQVRTLRQQAADAINASDAAAAQGDTVLALELHNIGVSLGKAAASLERLNARHRRPS